jgi:hypothetical protein
MAVKGTVKETPVAEILAVQDERLGKVVEEVDRFFRSVHANIEDWKFAMEDEGDGTRIFVRFQIHIHPSGSTAEISPPRAHPVDEGSSTVRGDAGRHPRDDAPGDPSDLENPDQLAAATKSDPDLALFVREWQRKRRNGPRVEFHESGAPLLDTHPEGKPTKRRRRAAVRP